MANLMFYPRQTDYIAKLNELAAQAGGGGGGGGWPGGGQGGIGIAPNYYGVLTEEPTTRNDGSACQVTDRYFNEGQGIEYTWNGLEWYQAYSAQPGFLTTVKEVNPGFTHTENLWGVENTSDPFVVDYFPNFGTGTIAISAQSGIKFHYSEYRFSTQGLDITFYPVGTDLGEPLFTMADEWLALTLTPTQANTNIQVRVAYMQRAVSHSPQ